MGQDAVVRLEFAPHEVSFGDALTRWLRAVPLLVLAGLTTTAGVLAAFVAGAVIVVTGRRSERLRAFAVYTVRVRVRAFSAFFLLRPGVPRLPATGALDDGADLHTEVSVPPPPTRPSRVTPFVRLALVIPWTLVGLPIALVLDLLYPVLVIAAGVRGGWSEGTGCALARIERWVGRVFLYVFFASDDRPPLAPTANAAV